MTLTANLGSANLHIQINIELGDQPTPPAEWIEYPVLLPVCHDPRCRAYRPETAIAEKLHAMVVLDLQNSRMKDFFDLFRLAQTHGFAGELLVAAVSDTFARRQTPIPVEPTAFIAEFAKHPSKVAQWNAFRKKSGLLPIDEDFVAVVEMIAQFLEPVMKAARNEFGNSL